MMSSRFSDFSKPCMPASPSPAPSLAAVPSRGGIFQEPAVQIGLWIAVVAGLTVLRAIFAVSIDLRVDEAYHWTWSKEMLHPFSTIRR